MALDFKKLENLKVQSTTNIKGGNFNKVIITGNAYFEGDISCKNFLSKGSCNSKGNIEGKNIVINGKASIDGNIKSKTAKLQGIIATKGNVDVEDLIIGGKVSIEKDLICKNFNLPGVGSIEGNINSECVYISGASHVKKDINTDIFVLSGGIVHEGMLNAQDVSITLGSKSKINNIKCEKINIKKPENTSKLFSRLLKKLVKNEVSIECKKIEGKKIYLENTKADLVRGKVVVIGEGCNIKKVEYEEEFKVIQNGKVVNNIKI
ncbi:polymer-forming cytoskeletal protein [Clostridium senegalense]